MAGRVCEAGLLGAGPAPKPTAADSDCASQLLILLSWDAAGWRGKGDGGLVLLEDFSTLRLQDAGLHKMHFLLPQEAAFSPLLCPEGNCLGRAERPQALSACVPVLSCPVTAPP